MDNDYLAPVLINKQMDGRRDRTRGIRFLAVVGAPGLEPSDVLGVFWEVLDGIVFLIRNVF